MLPPPAFTTFWSQAAQQGFKPKIVTMAKALLFPTTLDALGERGNNLTCELWWTPHFPFKSGLTGQSPAQFAAQWEKETGKQFTEPIGFQHSLFEVTIDTLRRTKNIDKPESILEAIRTTNLDTIMGHIQVRPAGEECLPYPASRRAVDSNSRKEIHVRISGRE